MTDGEILHIALEQSAIDCGCSASDFLSPANTVVVSRADPRARRYLELPFDCDLTCYGNGIVASVAGPLTEPVRGYIDRYPAEHCFETPNLLVLADLLPVPSGGIKAIILHEVSPFLSWECLSRASWAKLWGFMECLPLHRGKNRAGQVPKPPRPT